MNSVLVLSGACGSGKSTIARLLAEQHGWFRVSEDDVWESVFQNDRDRIGTTEHLRRRAVVRMKVVGSVGEAVITSNVVVDATVHDTDPTSVREYQTMFQAAGVPWQIRVLHPRLEVVVERDAMRSVRTLGAERVERLWRKFSGGLLDSRVFLDSSEEGPQDTASRVLKSLSRGLPTVRDSRDRLAQDGVR